MSTRKISWEVKAAGG